MGYLDLLKQLQGKPTPRPPWSPDEARTLHAATMDRLATSYPAGCLAWGDANQSDMVRRCMATYRAVEQAFASKDLASVRTASAAFEAANRALFAAFTTRDKPRPGRRPEQQEIEWF